MGCCSSSTAKTTKSPHPPPAHTNLTAKSTSLAPPDEETVVKEVLSETPISKPPPQRNTHIPPSQRRLNSISTNNSNIFTASSHQESNPPQPLSDNNAFPTSEESNPLPLSAKTNHTNVYSTTDFMCPHQESNSRPLSAGVNGRKAESKEENTPEVSQASSATTTVTEIRDDEVTSNRRAKLQTKRPGDRVAPVRRERPVNAGMRREVSSGIKRDIGEGSARRSRSPATRVAGAVGKGRGAGTPGKVTGGVGSRSVEKEGEKKEGNGGVSGEEQGSESLDNPLVSLECFIFL